jgi:hypothetical protein
MLKILAVIKIVLSEWYVDAYNVLWHCGRIRRESERARRTLLISRYNGKSIARGAINISQYTHQGSSPASMTMGLFILLIPSAGWRDRKNPQGGVGGCGRCWPRVSSLLMGKDGSKPAALDQSPKPLETESLTLVLSFD